MLRSVELQGSIESVGHVTERVDRRLLGRCGGCQPEHQVPASTDLPSERVPVERALLGSNLFIEGWKCYGTGPL